MPGKMPRNKRPQNASAPNARRSAYGKSAPPAKSGPTRRRRARKRAVRREIASWILTLALAAVLYGCVFGFTDAFVAIFNSENSALMAEYAHSGMRIYFAGYFFAGCNIVAAGYLGAVNRPTEATITSLSRGVVSIVTCSLVLSALFGMNGVWAAFPASEAITLALTVFLLARKQKT